MNTQTQREQSPYELLGGDAGVRRLDDIFNDQMDVQFSAPLSPPPGSRG